jgi:outer membrane protein OmpA-like peptidoglycan-associated protein
MKTFIATTVLAGCLIACGGAQVRQGADPELRSAAVGWPTLGQGSARYIRIDLGPDTFEECRRLAPKFPFDSATTYAQDRMQLAALATCLDAPGIRDRKLVLVGRADPRGPEQYNARLGLQRAEAIRQILIDNGIAPSRIEIATEGEKGVVGDASEAAKY